ncbi:hypothetical protein ACFX2B_003752 [Malus domestica]
MRIKKFRKKLCVEVYRQIRLMEKNYCSSSCFTRCQFVAKQGCILEWSCVLDCKREFWERHTNSRMLESRCIVLTFLMSMLIGLKAPGQGVHGMLQLVTEVIRSCSEYFVGLVMEAISAIISTFFDFLKGSVKGSAGVTTSAVVDLVEKTKTTLESLDGLLTDYPEISEGFFEMVYSIVNDMWNNYKDAFGYVTENA